MTTRRAAGVAFGLVVLAIAAVVWMKRADTNAPLPPDEQASSKLQGQRRPRSTKPRLAAPETREASVSAGASAEPTAIVAPTTTTAAPTRTAQLATTVLAAAVRHDWMVVDDHDTPCPPQQIRIIYDAPSDLGSYQKGAYFEPLGPGPGDSDVEVNGLMLCEGSTFLYRGFETYYRADRGQWDVFPFPVIE